MTSALDNLTPRTSYRLAIGVAVGTVLFLLFGIGALGIIGAGGEPDRMYLGVLAVLAVGTVLARLRPRGMAWALAATALAVVAVAVVALATGLQDSDGASVLEILGLTAMYSGLFGLASVLFRRAAGQPSPVATAPTTT